MRRTEYASLTTDELMSYVLTGQGRTSLEIELAQRLDVATSMLEENDVSFIGQESDTSTLDMLVG